MLCSSMQEVILHSHNCSIILKHSRTLLFDILVTYHACRSTIILKCSLVPMSSQVLLTLVVLFCYFLLFFSSKLTVPQVERKQCMIFKHVVAHPSIYRSQTIQWSHSVQCLHTSHVPVHTEHVWPLISSLILSLLMLFFFSCFFFFPCVMCCFQHSINKYLHKS